MTKINEMPELRTVTIEMIKRIKMTVQMIVLSVLKTTTVTGLSRFMQ
jgi:hypothetical protein